MLHDLKIAVHKNYDVYKIISDPSNSKTIYKRQIPVGNYLFYEEINDSKNNFLTTDFINAIEERYQIPAACLGRPNHLITLGHPNIEIPGGKY